MTDSYEELESLLFDWQEGELDGQGIEKLRGLLRNDEEARRHYVRLQSLDATLHLESETGLTSTSKADPRIEAASSLRSTTTEGDFGKQNYHVHWIAIAAVLLACIFGARLLQLELSPDITGSPQSPSVAPEAMASGVALVTRMVDVRFSGAHAPFEVGDALSPGTIAIESGYAQIEFFCGATVIVEGPAELELASAKLAHVHRGRLRAQVPPAARGFTLEVNEMKVVDLGTEFGISVTDEGTDVQVFDGEIEIHQPHVGKRNLTGGQGVTKDPSGLITNASAKSGDFVSIESLETRTNQQQQQQFSRWTDGAMRLSEDPRVVAFYRFDLPGTWKRKLHNATIPVNREFDGAIVGARRVDGRWPMKSALEFKQPGDRVRVQIPGTFQSLTFTCWTKIDSLDRMFNSLFLTDGYDSGEPHWQILDSGRIYFSVRPAPADAKGPRDFKAISDPFWKPSMSGKWLHLGVVFDAGNRRITHFLNGQILSAHEVPESRLPKTTRIGTASIGNWSQPTKDDASFAIRNLNGSIDEFAIFSAALSADEIREMYDNGKP